ncbi:MAG: SDR family oxidoreductase, partial [Planctomycetota bacterium]
GIGRATALAFARHGARLSLLARSQDRLDRLAEECGRQGAPSVSVFATDLEDRPATKAAVDRLLDSCGPANILVNNSGGPPGGPLLEATDEDFLKAFRRHVLASHYLVQRLLPGMVEAGWGRIINIISTSVKEPIPGLGVSNTIRGAMASWAKTLAKELPPGITINNVLPGFTDTDRLTELKGAISARLGISEKQVEQGWLATVPEARLGTPDELAAALLFLASPAAAFVRGQSLAVDGGRISSI